MEPTFELAIWDVTIPNVPLGDGVKCTVKSISLCDEPLEYLTLITYTDLNGWECVIEASDVIITEEDLNGCE